jgi:hypothetical protein
MKFDAIRLIYLHPARTGGSQIENILCDNLGISKGPEEQSDLGLMFGAHSLRYGNLQHLTLSEMSLLAAADLSDYAVLCSIRNPIPRFISAYFYNGCEKRYSRPGKLLVELAVRPLQHFLPQTRYTHENSTAIFDNLIRQEQYLTDLQRFCRLRGFTCSVQEHHNTVGTPVYSEYLYRNEIDVFHVFFTREERRMFYALYQQDFELLYPDYVDIVENML